MSLKFKRFENPEPGHTLLIEDQLVWTEQLPPERPEPKGVKLPTWNSIGATTLTMFALYVARNVRRTYIR